MTKKRLKILLAHSYGADPILWGMGERVGGWLVAIAKSYEQFVRFAEKMHPDIIITHLLFNGFITAGGMVVKGLEDMKMGEGGGVEDIVKHVREHPAMRETKIIIYSVTAPEEAERTCPGADAYIKANGMGTNEELLRTIKRFGEGQGA
ncbi:MAG: hypothetical protein IPN19_11900 [Elusimicrobia bacterium]|nr:hypothetical protein [Elusimicrobiota bacterium]